MGYDHTQSGNLIIVVSLIVALLFAFVLMATNSHIAVVITMFVILLILWSFFSLRVTVDSEFVRIKFGYGLFRKKIALKEIKSAKTVRNHWYYGWGIRYWPFKPMWIFNVSGFDAVQLTMKSGVIFRIGTDDPKNLEKAIMSSGKPRTK